MPVIDATGDPPKRGGPHADSLEQHLERVLPRLRRLTGAGLAFAGRVVGDAVELRYFDGPVVGPLRGILVEPSHGMGGRVIARGRPLAVADYLRTPLITHTYDAVIRAESLRAMVAAPIIVGRRQVGVLYAARREPHEQLGCSLDVVTEEARALEQTLAVSTALSGLREESDIAADEQWRAGVREAYDKLRRLAQNAPDEEMRARLQETADLLAGRAPADAIPVRLTPREQDVLELLAGGLTNNAIAELLGIGLYTVKGHVKSLMTKLDASSRFEAVVNARRIRLIP